MDETQIKQIIERQPLHGTALLDPRCKILLLVCIGFVSYFLAGEVVSLALMLVYGLFIALGNGGKWAAKMIITYIVVAYLNALLRYVQVPVLSVIMSVFGVTVLKLIPIVMMGLWILRTTYMDDLMVALQRMRLPQAVTIPLVVMFRYIPTLRIEYRQIRSTMDIRGISDTVWKRVCHPLATIEYILIPLLMRCLKVTDELAASGTTRGLELECKRYALRPIRFAWPEIVVSLLGIGKPNATEEEVYTAAKKARCYDFIMALPDGFQTVVGEGGTTLSGGEKQRISIARCILKDAPIIILDEATASVDTDNESYIQEAISELVKGKTLLVIAHRLNTIQNADQILVIDNGQIAQQGTHEELLKQPGIYQEFVNIRKNAAGWSLA